MFVYICRVIPFNTRHFTIPFQHFWSYYNKLCMERFSDGDRKKYKHFDEYICINTRNGNNFYKYYLLLKIRSISFYVTGFKKLQKFQQLSSAFFTWNTWQNLCPERFSVCSALLFRWSCSLFRQNTIVSNYADTFLLKNKKFDKFPILRKPLSFH